MFAVSLDQRRSSPQSYQEATAPLEETQQGDEDEPLSLHFQLAQVKLGLSEVRDRMEEVRMGESRSRGSGELGPLPLRGGCFDPAWFALMLRLCCL